MNGEELNDKEINGKDLNDKEINIEDIYTEETNYSIQTRSRTVRRNRNITTRAIARRIRGRVIFFFNIYIFNITCI